MASGSVFSGTLHTITSTKLEELSKQRASFSKQYAALLSTAKAEQDPLQRLSVVIDGTKLCLGVKTIAHKDGERRSGRVISGGTQNRRLETDLRNVDRFLDQARFDPSISTDVLKDWENKLLRYISVQATKYQYADLYGRLVTEWLSSEETLAAGGNVEMGESFEELPSTKKLQARAEWEDAVFDPAIVDLSVLKAYLERLFVADKKSVASSLNDLRKKVKEFEISLIGSSQFNTCTLRWVIESLRGSDLLSNEKREVLGDFVSNEIVLAEIADVLNMRLEALDCWTWGDHVVVEQRRNINGNFHIRMDEDILQAIFLHYIGVKWSVFFKAAFLAIRSNDRAWKSNCADVPKVDKKRRGFFLGDRGQKVCGNLEAKRSKNQLRGYFANQLLDHRKQQVKHKEGEEEADYADFVGGSKKLKRSKQTASKSAPVPKRFCRMASSKSEDGAVCKDLECSDSTCSEPESYDEDEKSDKNPMEAKQGLLHILATEIILNTRLKGGMACFRTVFESWGPLLPHDTVLTVLEFFGVSANWRGFFKTFLQAPLKFAGDDQSREPRVRRRGTPGSHILSEVFGELLLFCLDFSVNQHTNGALLHRLYDDVWFWNKDYETCVSAWECVLEFSEVAGVQIDDAKSGSIRLNQHGEKVINDRLPQGDIRWGFLYLNPSNGRFDIDRQMVDTHVSELRKQLQGKSKSVINWIQAWNSYAVTFFNSNFGKPANCFGREHVDMMLATHRHIQESVFNGGNVVQYLKQMINDRFGVSDLPDGFLYFPVELGGLDLKSPFVGLLQIRDSVKVNPYDMLDEYEESEKDDYFAAKGRFNKADLKHTRSNTDERDFRPDDAETFFSMEEFSRYREEFAGVGKASLRAVYDELLKRPAEEPIDHTPQVSEALGKLRGQGSVRGITSNWHSMDAYWRWTTQLYGPDVIARYGGLNIVDPGWLPIGLVGQFRQKRTKWQG